MRSIKLILLLAILAVLAACGMASGKPKADAAVIAFHEKMNTADFPDIWAAADDSFRQAGAREKYDKLMDAIHRKLGRVMKSTTANWSVRSFNFTTTVVLIQNTEFEHGAGTETFTYVSRGDEVKLAGYHIESDDLLTL